MAGNTPNHRPHVHRFVCGEPLTPPPYPSPHVYLSSFFCSCVSDPDVSINKRGFPFHNQSPAVFMFSLVLPTASAAQVESRCATKKLWGLLNGPAWALNVTTRSFSGYLYFKPLLRLEGLSVMCERVFLLFLQDLNSLNRT